MEHMRMRTPRAAAILGVAAILAGCTPEPATIEGARVKMLYDIFMIAAVVVFGSVAGLIAWSAIRYRSRDDGRQPSAVHDSRRLELIWWSLPTVLVIGLFVITAQVLSRIDDPGQTAALTVRVTGSQWTWQFAYQGTDVVVAGLPEAPPLVVLPIGRPIAFELESADVVHAFWVPRFLLKRDMIPERTNRIVLTIDSEGTYRGYCAEFCGLLHARMLFSIEAIGASDFDAWLADAASAAP